MLGWHTLWMGAEHVASTASMDVNVSNSVGSMSKAPENSLLCTKQTQPFSHDAALQSLDGTFWNHHDTTCPHALPEAHHSLGHLPVP